MPPANRCSRCDGPVLVGDLACGACGLSVENLDDAVHVRRNVYEPDESTSRFTMWLLGAGVLAVVVMVGVIVTSVISGGGSSSTTNPLLPGGALQIERQVQELEDGWWRLDVEDGSLSIDLPGAFYRSRADLRIETFGELPTAVWGGGFADVEVYGVSIGTRPSDWKDRDDEFLRRVPFAVPLSMVETDRRAVTLGDRPAIEVRGQGTGSQLRAITVLDGDRIVQVVVADRDADEVDRRFDRMTGSLTFGS